MGKNERYIVIKRVVCEHCHGSKVDIESISELDNSHYEYGKLDDRIATFDGRGPDALCAQGLHVHAELAALTNKERPRTQHLSSSDKGQKRKCTAAHTNSCTQSTSPPDLAIIISRTEMPRFSSHSETPSPRF